MERTIRFSSHAKEYLDLLTLELFKKNYFSYFESSLEYVDNLIDFIIDNLPKNIHKSSPKELIKYGSYYITYNSTQRTTW